MTFAGNKNDGRRYWLTPPDVLAGLEARAGGFDFDPCPYPRPPGFDGLAVEWGGSSFVNPPFGAVLENGRKVGPTAWVRKALAEAGKGKRVCLLYPVDKWLLMLLEGGASVANLGDVRWLSVEDRAPGPGTGRHVAAFFLGGSA